MIIQATFNTRTFATHDKQDYTIGLGNIFLDKILNQADLGWVLPIANVLNDALNDD